MMVVAILAAYSFDNGATFQWELIPCIPELKKNGSARFLMQFAPEILLAEAPSYAPRCRKMASCSDICHPIMFRSSNLGNKASKDAPVDDGPILASSPLAPPRVALGEVADKALSSYDDVSIVYQFETPVVEVILTKNGSSFRGDEEGLDCRLLVDSQAPLDDVLSLIDFLPKPGAELENHDLMVPSSDGKISKMVPTSAIDLDHTPSSITRLSSKYSLDVSNIVEPISTSTNGIHDRAKQKTRSRIKFSKSK
ncbi:hypothetical protein Nepgr_006645 [Nepenthes gracilis]|uniref:Uncharacterized protein n=1 Tax=Nepenthes gracilis TaxID=150966 RepID=A0AAD3S5U7_NEPGR|nr:hypothetical protein Nepgr_006645 [Nepenthes gracilis]